MYHSGVASNTTRTKALRIVQTLIVFDAYAVRLQILYQYHANPAGEIQPHAVEMLAQGLLEGSLHVDTEYLSLQKTVVSAQIELLPYSILKPFRGHAAGSARVLYRRPLNPGSLPCLGHFGFSYDAI